MRSGTLNVPCIVGLGEACRLRSLEMEEDEREIAAKRDLLQTLLLEKIPARFLGAEDALHNKPVAHDPISLVCW